MHCHVERPMVTLQHAVPLAALKASKPLLAHDHVGRNRDETPDKHAKDRPGDDLRASRRQTCLCCMSSMVARRTPSAVQMQTCHFARPTYTQLLLCAAP